MWESVSKLVTKYCKTSKSEISSGVEILYIFNAGFLEELCFNENKYLLILTQMLVVNVFYKDLKKK